ncbi:MAG: hypothetical protein ACOZCO_01555 [Bacteroidota bacterium]
MRQLNKFYFPRQDEKILVHTSHYDESGLLLKETAYNENGTFESETTYAYNENRQVIKEITTGIDEWDKTITEYHYQSDGKLLQERNVYPDGTFEHTDYFYEGDMTYITCYDVEGNILSKQEVKKENGKFISLVEKDSEKNIIQSKEMMYGKNGLEEKEIFILFQELKMEVSTWQYNENGDTTGSVTRYYTFDEYSKIEENDAFLTAKQTSADKKTRHESFYENYADPSENRKDISEFSENGLLLKSEALNPSEELFYCYEYEYNQLNEEIAVKKTVPYNFVKYFGHGYLFRYERDYYK